MNANPGQNPHQVSAAVGYRLWSHTYDIDPNPLLALERRTLIDKLDDLKSKVFLDVACGTGRSMVYASQMGAQVFGLDLAPEMLAIAREKPRALGRIVQADACKMPFPDYFADIVLCSFAVGYMRDPECLFPELGRVAKRGGMVIVTDLHPSAVAAGWRRTFYFGSTLFEIESYSHSSEQLIRVGRCANLHLREILQPHFESPEISIMRDAGKTDQIKEVMKVPAILVIIWERN